MENNKKIKCLQRKVCIIILVVALLVFGLYFYKFNGELSGNPDSWSSFGDYVNGMLTPILTLINLFVFIRMTVAISSIENRRTMNAMTIESRRHEKEMQHERNLLMIQLRKQEIDVFVKQMNRLFNDVGIKQIETLNHVADHLLSFRDTGLKWFEIENSQSMSNEIISLSNSLRMYAYKIENAEGFDEDLFNKIHNTKKRIINTLVDTAIGRNGNNIIDESRL